MTWVKDTLPPRARDRWLLITMRLSISSLTGTERTLVAVGTVRLASMFCAVRAGAPRSTDRVGSSTASALGAASGSLGTGAVEVGCGGRASARGVAWVGAETAGFTGALAFSCVGAGAWDEPLLVPLLVLVLPWAPLSVPFAVRPLSLKKSHQTLSTLSGSFR